MTRIPFGLRRLSIPLTYSALVAGLSLATAAYGQDYPAKNIRLVVPWPPGGIVDIAARTIADKAKNDIKHSFIVENRAGAGGSIGAAAVAKADADGYTLMFTTSALNMNAAIGRVPYDVARDFAPIVIVAKSPLVLVAPNTLRLSTVNDLIALAKAQPNELTYASAGRGSPAHFAAELFKRRAKIEAAHVAYKGAPEAMNDVMAGRITFLFANAAVALPQVQAGSVTGLAIASDRRSPLLPDVPTMSEAGIADFNADQWLGFLAPAATPKPLVEHIANIVKKALGDAEVRATLARNGIEVVADSTPDAFASLMKDDLQNWVRVAKDANIKTDQ